MTLATVINHLRGTRWVSLVNLHTFISDCLSNLPVSIVHTIVNTAHIQ